MSRTWLSVRYCFMFFLVVVTLLFNSSFATAVSWIVSSGDWSGTNPCPWDSGMKPNNSIPASIQNGGTATVTQWGESCSTLNLGGSNAGTLQIAGKLNLEFG